MRAILIILTTVMMNSSFAQANKDIAKGTITNGAITTTIGSGVSVGSIKINQAVTKNTQNLIKKGISKTEAKAITGYSKLKIFSGVTAAASAALSGLGLLELLTGTIMYYESEKVSTRMDSNRDPASDKLNLDGGNSTKNSNTSNQ